MSLLMTDTDTREMHEFLNRVRALHNVDRSDLPGPPLREWIDFVCNPTSFLIKADDATAAVIWRAMQARLGGEVDGASPDVDAVCREARAEAFAEAAKTARAYAASYDGDVTRTVSIRDPFNTFLMLADLFDNRASTARRDA